MPPQEVITKDNVVVSVDAVIYYEPTDPQRLVYNVGNFILAVTKLAQTNLRNLIGDMQLDEALTSRDSINLNLRQILDDATDKWGVRVVRVELQRIDPPPDVMHSMHEQMKAERTRRARRHRGRGRPHRRHHHAPRASGRPPSSPPRARSSSRSSRPRARPRPSGRSPTPSATARRRSPHGEANAIRLVYEAIHEGNPTPGLLAIKYLEALAGHGQRPGHQDHPAHRAGRASPARSPASRELISVNGTNEQRHGGRAWPVRD